LRVLQFVAATWLAFVCAIASAHAEKRVALVIGNGAYLHADRLANPVNDARGMRDALTALKFDVVYGEDLDLKELRRAVGRFNGRADGADVALVYFAGHGATFSDIPYVVPVDAEFRSLDEMPAELVAVEDLIGDLRRANTVRIAILDACRDNAAEQALKKSRGGPASRGLAPMKNPTGLIITYATQPGATAADSTGGGNSPFTAALIANIATPGVDVKDMFFKIGSDVIAATGGRQRPEISISMYERYALVPGTAPGGAASEAAQAWGIIQNTTSLAVLDDFIRQFGNAPIYGSMARARREELAKVAVVVTPPTGAPTVPTVPKPLTAVQERALKPKDTFRECENCPEMVVVPAGSFTMGSPAGDKDHQKDEGPQHVVRIGSPLAAGKMHVTVDQFKAFVDETRYAVSTPCYKWPSFAAGGSWRNPGFAQEGSHPVVCVSFEDAKAYADWLAKKTGKRYRLLSEAEWEYAARGQTSPGAYPRFWFGNDEKDLCTYGNGSDKSAQDIIKENAKSQAIAPCNDGYAYTSPAGHYQPNAFGLYDMAGNAWQWTADCYHDSYNGAPSDGSAWTTGCGDRVVRGGFWGNGPEILRAAQREWFNGASNRFGFRVARTLAP
jgi:formylglycine-generating enzyme required for sulfatase activity